MISKILQILGLQPRISNVFFNHYNIFFLTVGQNNFGNKIPIFPHRFVKFEDFLPVLRGILHRHGIDLASLELQYFDKDQTAFLIYVRAQLIPENVEFAHMEKCLHPPTNRPAQLED